MQKIMIHETFHNIFIIYMHIHMYCKIYFIELEKVIFFSSINNDSIKVIIRRRETIIINLVNHATIMLLF
jgi:hypothetical protein